MQNHITTDAAGLRWLCVPIVKPTCFTFSAKRNPYELSEEGINYRAIPEGAMKQSGHWVFFGARDSANWSEGVAYRASDEAMTDEWVRVVLHDSIPVRVEAPRVIVCGFQMLAYGELAPGITYIHRDDLAPNFCVDRTRPLGLRTMPRTNARLPKLYEYARQGRVKIYPFKDSVAYEPSKPLTASEWEAIGYFTLRQKTKSETFAIEKGCGVGVPIPATIEMLKGAEITGIEGATYDPVKRSLSAASYKVGNPSRFSALVGIPEIAAFPPFTMSQHLAVSLGYRGWSFSLDALQKLQLQIAPGASIGIDLASRQIAFDYPPQVASFTSSEPVPCAVNGTPTMLILEEWVRNGIVVEACEAKRQRVIPKGQAFHRVAVVRFMSIRAPTGWYVLGSEINRLPTRREAKTSRDRDAREKLKLARERFGDLLPKEFAPLAHTHADVEQHLAINEQLAKGEVVKLAEMFGRDEVRAFRFFANASDEARLKWLRRAGVSVTTDPLTQTEFIPAMATIDFLRHLQIPVLESMNPELPRFVSAMLSDAQARRELSLVVITGN